MPEAEIKVGNFYVNLSQELGRGGFGNVYKAADCNGRPIAAKKVPVQGQRRAAARESVNSYSIPQNHPNIIKIFDVRYDYSRHIWIFMEICEGHLRHYCQNHTQELQSMKHRFDLMIQIAQGVDYLHHKGIVHRDIKLENIMIRQEDGHSVAKISDFGLAKILDPTDETSGMSTDVGTFNFKAPEFWKRDAENRRLSYHRNVDIFSLGLTYLCMLQISDGRALYPEIENTMDTSTEQGKPIGMVMYYRELHNQPDVNVIADKEDDSVQVKGIKDLIRDMTCVRPQTRPQIDKVLADLKKVRNLVSLVLI